MPGASVDHIQPINSAAPPEAFCTSSDVGYDCQKFFRLAASPPLTSPAKTSPVARLPAPAGIQALSGLVRLRTVNPSAFGWTSLKSSHTAQSASRPWPRALQAPLSGTRLPAI